MAKLIITDVADALVQQRYVRKESPSLERLTLGLWRKMGTVVTVGSSAAKWKGPWTKMIREYVRDDVTQGWLESITIAGSSVARKINRLQRKQYEFDETMRQVKAWLDAQGGKLIVDLTAAQMASARVLLQAQIALGVTSPQILAARIRPLIGITVREASAVSKFMAALTEEGVSPAAINARVNIYAKYLHKNRAARIAQTELSNAYNFGQMNSIEQAVKEGWLPDYPKKDWLAAGTRPCDVCLGNAAAGAVGFKTSFPSGHVRPTAHPLCACSISYTVVRR